MLSYEVYKVIHVLSILVFYAAAAVSLYSQAPKHIRVISGITTALIFIAGMGLLARIGLDHGAGFPLWVWAKMLIWLVLAIIVPVGAKRAPEHVKRPLFYISVILFVFAHYFAIFKP